MWIEIWMPLYQGPQYPVTPFAGVWIEMHRNASGLSANRVTPFAGVWIEMEEAKKE